MQVLAASISVMLFDVSIMLNLPIVNELIKSQPWLHVVTKQTLALCGQFNCHIRRYNFYIFYCSVLTLISFAMFTENTQYVFKILSIH